MYFIYALKFVFALAIARILTPHDYGLIAYTAIFMIVAGYFSGVGFEVYLVQKKNPTEVDYSTGFYFNLTLNLIFVLGYFLIAGKVADYFNEPELKLIFRVASLNLILNALFPIHYIKLTKVLKFKQQAIINFISSLLGSIIGLIWAYVYADYWALVFQTMSGTFFKMLGYWYFARWKPLLTFSWTSWYQQFKFGSKVFVQGIVDSISRESYTYFIGKFHSTEILGVYNRALQFYNLFIVQLSLSFNKVLYPAMSQYVTGEFDKKRIYHKTYLILFAIFVPLSLFFYLNAHHIIYILLNEKWMPVRPLLKILFLGGVFSSLISFNSTTVLSLSKPGLFLKMEIINKLVLFIVLCLTFRMEVKSIIYGWLAAGCLVYIISEIVLIKLGYFQISKYYSMLLIGIAIIPTLFFHDFVNSQFRNLYVISSLEFIFLIGTYLLFIRIFLKEVFFSFTIFFKLGKKNAENK